MVLVFLRSGHYTASHSSNLLHNTSALLLPFPIPVPQSPPNKRLTLESLFPAPISALLLYGIPCCTKLNFSLRSLGPCLDIHRAYTWGGCQREQRPVRIQKQEGCDCYTESSSQVPGIKENMRPRGCRRVVKAKVKAGHELPSTELGWMPGGAGFSLVFWISRKA